MAITYWAYVETGVVMEPVIEIADGTALADIYPADFVAACVALTSEQAAVVKEGWLYDGSAFTAPTETPASSSTPPMTGPVVITHNGPEPALRVTQTGAGPALLIEDADNPDSTPFLIDEAGNVVVGHTAKLTVGPVTPSLQNVGGNNASSLGLIAQVAGASGPRLALAHSRSATPGLHTVLVDGDSLGRVDFFGSDGAAFVAACALVADVQGTPSTGIVSGRLRLFTMDAAGAFAERLSINGAGQVSLGGAPAGAAALTVTSTKGGLVLPRMTTGQRDAITPAPDDGTLIYNSTAGKFQKRQAGAWVDF